MNRGRLAFDRGIGRDDHFIQATALNPFHQRWYAQLLRTHTMQRRNGTVKNVIDAVIKPGFFDGSNIRGLFHHANQTLVSGGTGAVATRVNISNIATYRTKMKFFFKIADGCGESVSILSTGPQNVKRKALGALAAHARKFL